MKTERKKRNKSTDYFAFFKKAAADAFNFLVTDYGFRHVSTFVHMPDCAIKYQNETTGVTVFYEWQSAIGVDLIRLRRNAGEVLEGERHGLDFLIRERCPTESVKQSRDYSNEEIKRIVQDYANLLKECGSEILMGDFRVMRKLKRIVEEEQRKRNLDLYGSGTGETPK